MMDHAPLRPPPRDRGRPCVLDRLGPHVRGRLKPRMPEQAAMMWMVCQDSVDLWESTSAVDLPRTEAWRFTVRRSA